MRGSDFLIITVPLYILWLLMPALEASSYSAPLKGGFIGLYCGISIIGIMKMRAELQAK